ncbi:hypothetical protein BGZ68_009640 [Mortierella alpina]|nr:hypothetical protein BGZ68_009640 [Mortierella alpina]
MDHQGFTNNNSTQNQDLSKNAHSRPGSSIGSKPGSWRDYKQQQDRQQQDSQQQTYEQHQQEQEQERGQEQEQEQGQRQRQQGQQLQQSHRQQQQPLQSPTPQPYQQQIRSGPINGLKKEPSNAWPAEDEGNTTFHRTPVPNNESGRTSRMDAVFDIPDDPLFLQYPIGDGCHVVVAMYVERSAEAAAGRFPAMTRKRQESSWKQKSVDEVAAIFKQALIEEKKDITG